MFRFSWLKQDLCENSGLISIFTYFDLISVENKNHCEFAQLRDMLIK